MLSDSNGRQTSCRKVLTMRRETAKTFTGSVILVCGLAVWINSRTLAQQSTKSTTPLVKRDHVSPANKPRSKASGPFNRVTIGIEGLDEAFSKKILKACENLPERPSRQESFAALNNPEFQFMGWHLQVQETKDDKSGHLVRIDVAPRLEMAGGTPVTIVGSLQEWYRLDDSGWHYLKTEPFEGHKPVVGFITD